MSKRYFVPHVLALVFIFQIATSVPVSASSLSTTTLATPAVANQGANDYIQPPAANGMSDDGRITVFSTGATNVIPNDTNDMYDVFAYDRITRKTEIISHDAAGRPANYSSYNPTVSGDGRFVTYMTMASNIVPGTTVFCDGSAICINVAVYDRLTKATTFANRTVQGKRISNNIQTIGQDAPMISNNGRFIAYQSPVALIATDTNDTYDIFVYDRQTHMTRVASIDNNGHTAQYDAADASISGDGRYVTFTTYSGLVASDTNDSYDNYVHDMQTGATKLLSATPTGRAANGGSFNSIVSDDGSSAVFMSYANNLVSRDTNGQTDAFLRDLRTGKTQLVSISSKGRQANGGSSQPAVSGDGRFVVFSSWATNLTPNDTNDMYDVFLYDRNAQLLRCISRASHDGEPAKGGSLGSWQPMAISGDGRAISFTSDATNLTPTKLTSSTPNMYLNYNPVVAIPYYDDSDFFDLLP